MSITKRKWLLTVALRVATLGSRFLLIFFLARFLKPVELGIYGLVTATIGYALYLVGFDFYTYTTREVLKHESKDWGGLLKNQGALWLVLYGLFLPLLSLIFIFDLLPLSMAGWFFVLLIFEHINQELSRLLIAISEQLAASMMLFLRQGTWAIMLVVLMVVEPSTRSLDYVFGAWAVAGFVTLLAGVYRLAQINIGGWRTRIDWRWIVAGVKISIPFLLATLALRAIFTLDRYWLQTLGGLEVVGAYVLFMGIGGTLMAFLDAGVFAFSYPGLIAAYHKKQPELFRKRFRLLLIQTVMLSLGFAVVSVLLLSPLLNWLGNPVYVAQKYLYPWVLGAMTLYALGMVPHYALYAQGADRPIIQSHVVSVVVFVVTAWGLSKNFAVLAVPLSLCVTFAFVLIWKTWAFFKIPPFSTQTFVA